MINIIEYTCTTFNEPTRGVLHTGSIPFVVCPRCGATHVLLDKKFSAVNIDGLEAQLKHKEQEEQEELKEEKNEEDINKS
jgi:hypothetical protein